MSSFGSSNGSVTFSNYDFPLSVDVEVLLAPWLSFRGAFEYFALATGGSNSTGADTTYIGARGLLVGAMFYVRDWWYFEPNVTSIWVSGSTASNTGIGGTLGFEPKGVRNVNYSIGACSFLGKSGQTQVYFEMGFHFFL